MELKDILKDIIDEINKRFTECRKEYFRLGKIKIDRSNGHHIIDVQIIPFYQNDDMNTSVHIYVDNDKNEIELRRQYKYENNINVIYKRYIDHVPKKQERKPTGFKELDNWLDAVDKSLTVYYDNPLFDKNDLVDMFMGYCKDYFLAAEKYYRNKAITDKLYEEMKHAEYKI